MTGSLTAAGAAFGIGALVTLAIWRLGRRFFSPGRVVEFGIAAALGWMILLRAWALPSSPWAENVQAFAAAGVGTAWFVLIRDAVRAMRAERE